MEPLAEAHSMDEVIEYLTLRTDSDIQKLYDMGFDGTIGSIPGINTIRIPHKPTWHPSRESPIMCSFIGSQNSSKSSITSAIARNYSEYLFSYPSIIPALDFFTRHHTLATHLRIHNETELFNIKEVFNGIEAELFFNEIRRMLQIPAEALSYPRDQDHPEVRGMIREIQRALFAKKEVLKPEDIENLLTQYDITPELESGIKVARFLSFLHVVQPEDFIHLSFRDQVDIFGLLQIVFPEIDFKSMLRVLDGEQAEKDNPYYNEIIHHKFLKYWTELTILFLTLVKDKSMPDLFVIDEGIFSDSIYVFTNIMVNRLRNAQYYKYWISEEERRWDSLRTYIEGFNLYHIVVFFFAYPEQSLQREGEHRGYIMNERYVNLFYKQQLAMFSRLLHAGDLPFIVIPIDASGAQAKTYSNLMNCFNAVMQLAGKDFRLGSIAF